MTSLFGRLGKAVARSKPRASAKPADMYRADAAHVVAPLQATPISSDPGEPLATHCRSILRRLVLIAERFPREYDYMYRALVDMLRAFEASRDLTGFVRLWSALVNDVVSTPQWVELLFPEVTASDPTLELRLRAWKNGRYLPDGASRGEVRLSPVPDGEGSTRLFDGLLDTLLTSDPATGPPFLFLSRFYLFRDLLFGYFVDESLQPVQRAIFHQCYQQRRNWRQSYAADYPYQGMERLGISGIKPTEERFLRYGVAEYLRPSDNLLDIGSNNGFWALALASRVGHVDGLEFNPYLIAIANIAKENLAIENASFIPGDFVDFETSQGYDVVCSLANHCTIDGNLSMDFEQYIAKVFSLLKPGGILLFESHNVFGPGTGAPGDDGDLDEKFDIAERYFSVLKYRMTPAYVPTFDIDKLFIVMRRRERYQPDAIRTLRLAEARERYGY